MENEKKLAAVLSLSASGEAMCFPDTEPQDPLSLCSLFDGNGADELLVMDGSEKDQDHDANIGILKTMIRTVDIPVITGGRVRRMEDVKKYLYAGAKAVYLNASVPEHIDLLKEVSDRFGSEKILVWLDTEESLSRVEEYQALGAGGFLLWSDACPDKGIHAPVTLFLKDGTSVSEALLIPGVQGVVYTGRAEASCSFMEEKTALAAKGLTMNILTSPVAWRDMKLGADGLLPVIIQDYQTGEVLMMAYMNEQAFLDTLRTGKMHYYSRSRKTQWLKGETSGHFQYVKSLHLDCDNDTLLAKVSQIGAACHTGSRSCFFQTLVKKDYADSNPLKVFEDVYGVIMDRKEHPKEGSYTNYLFDKGLDKILKKVGEEAAEIIIAAKNPDPEEIIYEISDFLYHAMVLMAEKGVTWEDITHELANR